jgi:hypothetical protein
MALGKLEIENFLESVQGEVRGELESDAKDRHYKAQYRWQEAPNTSAQLLIRKRDGTGDTFKMPKEIELTRSLTAFFGFYSGDGSKGTEDRDNLGHLNPSVGVSSQIEPDLASFTMAHLKSLFPDVGFRCTLGEDSAFFMAGEGKEALREKYGGIIPDVPDLEDLDIDLSSSDERYLKENRSYQPDPERDLAFYHYHKEPMREILTSWKEESLKKVGISPGSDVRITASTRRPYKKGPREPGKSSRSDELHTSGVNGAGELMLFILSEIEDSVLRDKPASSHGLVRWNGKPSEIGEEVSVIDFFQNSPYGQIGDERPRELQPEVSGRVKGRWDRSVNVVLSRRLKIDPLWCYTSGLYLAEGSTKEDVFFSMFAEKPESQDLSLSFTSTERKSLELVLRALAKLFRKEKCLKAWKLKVGSQYLPETVVAGLKNAVPVLRGGNSGQGKMRTAEISLDLKDWALEVAPVLKEFEHRYTHVEPTGAGVPRIDFRASSSLCRWYFPLLMYSIFSDTHGNPVADFS